MSRKPRQRIDDIIECREKILRFTSGMNQEQFVGQALVMDAVLRNIEIIGEATKHFPDDVRDRLPGIPLEEDRRDAGLDRARVLPGR